MSLVPGADVHEQKPFDFGQATATQCWGGALFAGDDEKDTEQEADHEEAPETQSESDSLIGEGSDTDDEQAALTVRQADLLSTDRDLPDERFFRHAGGCIHRGRPGAKDLTMCGSQVNDR